MRLGCFGSVSEASAIKDAGFDYLEVDAQEVLQGRIPSSQWSSTAPNPDKLPLPIEAANCLLPGDMPVIGAGRNMNKLQQYVRRVATRAEILGIRYLVFGSSGARRRPDGVSLQTADRHLREFMHMTCEICADRSIMVLVEHLNSKVCNTINTLGDAAALCDELDLPNANTLVDTYHFALENEDEQSLLDHCGRLKYIHVAEPVGRIQPGAHGPVTPGGKSFDFENFFRLLHKIEYDGPISVEAKWNAPIAQAGTQCVSMVRRAWDQPRVTARKLVPAATAILDRFLH